MIINLFKKAKKISEMDVEEITQCYCKDKGNKRRKYNVVLVKDGSLFGIDMFKLPRANWTGLKGYSNTSKAAYMYYTEKMDPGILSYAKAHNAALLFIPAQF